MFHLQSVVALLLHGTYTEEHDEQGRGRGGRERRDSQSENVYFVMYGQIYACRSPSEGSNGIPFYLQASDCRLSRVRKGCDVVEKKHACDVLMMSAKTCIPGPMMKLTPAVGFITY